MAAQPLAGGKAMVTGGTNIDWISFSSTRIWDPAGGTWSLATGLMATARSFPTSALLQNGNVLVAGGAYRKGTTNKNLATAEVFDPATGKWTLTGSMKVARWGAHAVTLADGRVLVAGGWTGLGVTGSADTEIWDPSTGKWTAAGATPSPQAFSLVALPDGSALLAGGFDLSMNTLSSAYRFDPTTLKWTAVAKMKTAAGHRSAAVLANGLVLVAGGLTDTHKPATTAAELFDPVAGTWTATVAMPAGREDAGAVLLPDGSVMLAGGSMGYYGPASTPWCPKNSAETLRYIPAVP
jgi:N-acetylneuraminic acid mutarotase